MKKFTLLLEELSSYEKEYLRKKLGGSRYNSKNKHKNMFDSYQDKTNPDRITLPLETNDLNDKVDSQIKFHLKTNGWDVHNYHAGLVSRQSIDRDGNDKLEIRKIGKVLQQTGGDKVIHSQPRDRLIKGSDGQPLVGSDGRYKSERVPQSLLDYYNADPVRSSVKAEHNIVISRDLDDIGGMTSGRDWANDSCMRLPKSKENEGGGYHHHIKNDLQNHTLVAYATKRGDDELEDPVGRVLIKKYSTMLPNGKSHDIYRPEKGTYGDLPDGFTDHVEEIMKKHYPAKPDMNYHLSQGLYNDGRLDIQPIKTGLHKFPYGATNYNSRGELHDYVDENGVHQPAINEPYRKEYYKNGKLHRDDDEPAKTEIGGDIKILAHYKNGELHRDGDLPAKYVTGSDAINDEYYYGGMLHRANNKPSVLIKNRDGDTIEKYHYAGLLHRTDGAAVTVKNKDSSLVEHRIFGKLTSPDANTPARHAINYRNNGAVENSEIYTDSKGDVHRDGDLPALVSNKKHFDGAETTVEQYYKNGLLHRQNGQPAYIKHDKPKYGGETIEKQWSENGHPIESESIPFREFTKKGKLIKQEFNHNNPDKPTEIDYDTNEQTSIFGNRKAGKISETKSDDGEHQYEIYKNKKDLIRTEGDNPIFQYSARSGNPNQTIFRDPNDDIHLIRHGLGYGYKISEAGKIHQYRIDNESILGNHKNSAKHFHNAKKILFTEQPNLKYTLNHQMEAVKQDLIDAKVPQHHIDMIDEIHRRLNLNPT